MNFFPAIFGEVTDPVDGNGGAGIYNVENFHGAGIIRHCPNR
jgi:hypothetical protein